MATIELHYGVWFGPGDASDWIWWDAEATDEELAIYERDMRLRIDPNDDERLAPCLHRAYREIEAEEVASGIADGVEYTLECTGRQPVDPKMINMLVRERDEYTLEFFHLEELSEEELDKWNARDLPKLPDVCDFDLDFEPMSPYDAGWTLNVCFYEPEEKLPEKEARETLAMLFEEKDFDAAREFVERVGDWWYEPDGEKYDLVAVAKEVAEKMGALEEFEGESK